MVGCDSLKVVILVRIQVPQQMKSATKKLGKVATIEYGKHTSGKRWFSSFLYAGDLATFFCSWGTQAYDTALQSGIGFILKWPFRIAVFLSLLDYPEGSLVEAHNDGGPDPKQMKPVIGCNFNIVLKKAKIGGEFICPQAWVNTSRVKIFNGDKFQHEVTKIEKGNRVLLAFKVSLARYL
jgi:hypothetical protein